MSYTLPAFPSKDDIAAVVKIRGSPGECSDGNEGVPLSVSDLSAIGVRRISVGSALCRAAIGAFLRSAKEMQDNGTFNFANDAVSTREIGAILKT